jgi:hypothetical protein
MTSTAQSARVDVLTAEVRVLMVGSRQVTLSVFRQLDTLWTTDQFEPFGRVRDGRASSSREVQLVGRDTTTGALVRYTSEPPDWSRWEGPRSFRHWLRHQKGLKGGPYPVAQSRNRSVMWTGQQQPNDYQICDGPYGWHVDDGEPPNALRYRSEDGLQEYRNKRCAVDLADLKREWSEQAQEELDELLEAEEVHDKLKALPLIVLAGLK